jgi:LysR family transcriptional regulator, nitrogen assimilation regulatory protein
VSIARGQTVDLARLRLFARVADVGSITQAAAMLDTVQPAISRQIAALERECGGRLFKRTGRGVALTELGERIMPRVRALLNDADQLESDIKGAAHVPTGDVRLGILPSTARPLVNLLYRRAYERFPGIRLRLFEGSSGQVDEWLATGRIDIGILYRYQRIVRDSEQPLAVVDSFLVGPAKDAVTRNATVRFAQIHRLPLVLPGIPNGLRVILDQVAREKGVALTVVMEADSIPIQKDFVIDQTGYTILPMHAVAQEVRAGLLQASRITSPGIDRTITLGTARQRPPGPPAREIIGLIREIVDELAVATVWKRRRP